MLQKTNGNKKTFAFNQKSWNVFLKPVAIKKVEPWTKSEIVNEAWQYSYTWKPVKKIAKNIVAKRLWFDIDFSPTIIALWQTVTVAPDVSRIKVFNKGTSHGLKVSIPKGGQTPPISIAGAILEWKKAQKKAKKNITSETINKTIPIRKPYSTGFVCWPSKVPSRTTSRHHVNIIKTKKLKLKLIKKLPPM